jgi:uncharacterized membrane protein
MKKNEFFSYLKNNLKNFNNSEITEITKYYDELIEEKKDAGLTEDEAIASFGDLKILISQITSDLVITRSTNAPKNNAWRNFWIILGVCSFPIAFPLFIVLLVMGIVAISLIIAFGATALGLIVGFIPMIIASIREGADLYTIMIQAGSALMVITFFILLVCTIQKYGYLVLNKLTKAIASLVKKLSSKER